MKTWTVITKPVKHGSDGIIARERYLRSSTHPNHSNTEAIFDVVGSQETSKKIIISGERYKLRQKLRSNRRGRPVSSLAMEFCLTLPKTYRPSREQWRLILSDCCKALAMHLALVGVERKEFFSQIRAVCHRQNQSSGSGDHCHMLVPKIIGNRVLTDLQRKKSTALLKQAYTTAVSKHVDISITDYKPFELNRGRRLEKWQYESRKQQLANDDNSRILKKLDKQIEKYQIALANSDTAQLRRQRNRINKSISELDTSAITPELKTKIDNIIRN
ncbi:hypothetical protein CGJ21_11035 [Vibrio parahaemolyticus]|nr:hypothetical protein CGJ23_10600 [Vibrio parahaemolyticus]TOF48565.1 hypothetical protein CGJ21_11035 [Vibrio parahaemolyticus]